MKILLCIAIVPAFLTTPSRIAAQNRQAAFLTASAGAISYTNEYSPSGYLTPNDLGYMGRIGLQITPFGDRFRFGAEYRYSRVQEKWRSGLADWGFCRPPCPGEPTELSGVSFNVQSVLGPTGGRIQPYALLGAGRLHVADVSDDIGPGTDLGFGLALKPFRSDLILFAVDARYTFFYLANERDVEIPSNISLAATTSVRLVRW